MLVFSQEMSIIKAMREVDGVKILKMVPSNPHVPVHASGKPLKQDKIHLKLYPAGQKATADKLFSNIFASL